MNRDYLQGCWWQLRGALLEQWSRFTGDSAAADDAARLRLAGRRLLHRGTSSRAAERQIADFLRRNRNWRDPRPH